MAKSDSRPDTFIEVERINGPILLVSGQKDEIWPSPDMAQRIVAQLLKAGFAHDVENIVYAGSGHYVLANSPATMARVLAFFHRTLKEKSNK